MPLSPRAASRRLAFERLLANLSAKLIALPPEQVDEAIDDTLRRMARFLDLDRSTVWVRRSDDDLQLTHQWARPDLQAPHLLARQALPWTYGRLMAGEMVQFSTLDELPAEAAVDRETFTQHGPRSTTAFPLTTGGTVFGAIGFGTLRRERKWPSSLTRRLALLAQLVSHAMHRRNADADLRASEERVHLTVAWLGLGLWEWDLLADRVWTSGHLARALGWPSQTVYDYATLLSVIHPADRAEVDRALRQTVDSGRDLSLEYRMRRATGGSRWVRTFARCTADSDGRTVRLLGVTQDVTEFVMAQEGERKAREELAHVTRVTTLSALAGSLAHELNQPLTAILTNAEASRKFLQTDPSQVDEILADIVSDVDRAGQVISRMRDLIRKRAPEAAALDLLEMVREVLPLARGTAHSRQIEIDTRGEEGLHVRANRVQLQQVVLNLLVNALDALEAADPPDGRAIAVEVAASGPTVARVSVSDNGPGLAPSVLETIFQPFHSTKREGLGLGLSISRSLIHAHGGQMGAHNNPAGGATVWFTLPLSAAAKGAP